MDSTACFHSAPSECRSEDLGSADELNVEANAAPTTVFNFKLNAAIETSLSRRGRKRFHELQANNPSAKIRFDRRRQQVRISGTEATICTVCEQLEALAGVHKAVPQAVWCELMRTRHEEEVSQSLLLQLQERSGCRIHIERGQQEVRIFGPDRQTSIAEQLVDDLADMCTEEEVAIPDCTTVSPSTLQYISETCEVTVSSQKEHITVSGRHEAVAAATAELRLEFVDNDYVDTDDPFDGASSVPTHSASWSEPTTPRHFSRSVSEASASSVTSVPLIRVVQPSSGVEACPAQTTGSNGQSSEQSVQLATFVPVPVVVPFACYQAYLVPPSLTSSAPQSRSSSPCSSTR